MELRIFREFELVASLRVEEGEETEKREMGKWSECAKGAKGGKGEMEGEWKGWK